MAFQKTQELWAYLSEDEPGNQARPETMEQLIVLLTRETTRRMVHFINYTRNAVTRFPETLKKTQHAMMQQLINVTKYLAKLIRTRPITTRVNQEVAAFQDRLSSLYDEVQNYATNRLVNIMEMERNDGGQSMALAPYLHSLQPATATTNDELDHHRLFPTNRPPINFTFQCSIHSVFSAVSYASPTGYSDLIGIYLTAFIHRSGSQSTSLAVCPRRSLVHKTTTTRTITS